MTKQLSKDTFWKLIEAVDEKESEKNLEKTEESHWEGSEFLDDFMKNCDFDQIISQAVAKEEHFSTSSVSTNGEKQGTFSARKFTDSEKLPVSSTIVDWSSGNAPEYRYSVPPISSTSHLVKKSEDRTRGRSVDITAEDNDIDMKLSDLKGIAKTDTV